MLCGEMYGAPYDLLAAYLEVRPDRLRGIAARWRAAGYAQTGRLGPGPAWCWQHLLAAVTQFLDERIFGPERARLLAELLPVTAGADEARREKQAAKLRRRLQQIDAAEQGHTKRSTPKSAPWPPSAPRRPGPNSSTPSR